MKLHEILHIDDNYEVVRATPGGFRTRKVIGDHTLIFVASLDEDSDNVWQVAFFDRKDGGRLSAEPTNDHKAFDVLSFVGSSIKEFIERYVPEKIVYSIGKDTVGEKRAGPYALMFKKFAPEYEQTETSDAGADKYVTYSRKS